MKKHGSIILLCALLLSLVLGGCGGNTPAQSETTTSAAQTAPAGSNPAENYGELAKVISIGGNPIGQTAYTWAAAISDIVNKKVGVNATAEETKGYPENARLIVEGEIEFGFVNNMMLEQVYNATDSYTDMEPHKVLGVMSISPTEMHIFKMKGSDVDSVKDFKGKRIGLGQPGGISLEIAQKLLEALGYAEGDFKGFQVNLAEQCSMLQDGQLDVAIWIGSATLPAITELATSKDIEFLPIPDDVLDTLTAKYPSFSKCAIPAGSYRGQDEDVQTFCAENVLAAGADVTNETVYQVTKTIMENLDGLAQVHPSFGKVTKDTVLTGLTTPLHPGALRYYQEINVPGIEKFAN